MFPKASLVFAFLLISIFFCSISYAQNENACERAKNYNACIWQQYQKLTCLPLSFDFNGPPEQVAHNNLRLECYSRHYQALYEKLDDIDNNFDLLQHSNMMTLLARLPAIILYNSKFSNTKKDFDHQTIISFYEKNVKPHELKHVWCEKAFEDVSKDNQFEYNLCFQRDDNVIRNYYHIRIDPYFLTSNTIKIEMSDLSGNFSECSIVHLHYNSTEKYEIDAQSPWIRCG